jgi:hypothetical protein
MVRQFVIDVVFLPSVPLVKRITEATPDVKENDIETLSAAAKATSDEIKTEARIRYIRLVIDGKEGA